MAQTFDKLDEITKELGNKSEQLLRQKRGTKNLIHVSMEQELLKTNCI